MSTSLFSHFLWSKYSISYYKFYPFDFYQLITAFLQKCCCQKARRPLAWQWCLLLPWLMPLNLHCTHVGLPALEILGTGLSTHQSTAFDIARSLCCWTWLFTQTLNRQMELAKSSSALQATQAAVPAIQTPLQPASLSLIVTTASPISDSITEILRPAYRASTRAFQWI